MSGFDLQLLTKSAEFAERHDHLQRFDHHKDEFIRRMISRIMEHENRLEIQAKELEQKKDLLELYHTKFKIAEQECNRLKIKQEQSNFTLVLLDGDIMLFHDDYLERGVEGGKEAARGLKAAVENYMDGKGISSRILVQIYANVSGLKKVYSSSDVSGFIQGFNMFDGLYQIVDAGNGKECSDEKVKKLFELFIKDMHCNHIIFGVSADNGYARLLEAYAGNDRLTLLEGPPFASELASIVKQSQTTQFTSIFRSTKKEIFVHQPSGSPKSSTAAVTAPQVAPTPIQAPAPAPPPASAPPSSPAQTSPLTTVHPNTYAALVSRPAATKTKSHSPSETKTPKQLYSEDGFAIHHNARGERVDEKIKVSPKEIEAIKGKKLCNNYHLFNNCPNDDDDCEHRHGPRLSETEQLAQRALARSTPCFAGSECTNSWCTCGHQCFFGLSCNRRPGCRFPHIGDTKIVRTIKIK